MGAIGYTDLPPNKKGTPSGFGTGDFEKNYLL